MANQSIYDAFERFWMHVVAKVGDKADISHTHDTSDIASGTLSSDRLPTVPIDKGGTGATTAADALTNLGMTMEQWSFELEDGTTVTKQVVVGV